ncbi:pyridoxal phosphate-dependent transferase [Trichoderma afarasin]
MATEDKSAIEATTEANLPNVSEKDVDRALLRKIDWRVMPVLCVTYALQYWDKGLLGQAAVFGLRTDLGLTQGKSFSWVSVVFYFGHIAGMYPGSLLAQRFHPKRTCSILAIVWSIIMLTTPACTSYAGIIANRFFLGVVEAGVNPVFMLVVGTWYTHSEQVLRSSIWYSFSGGSLLISPVINFGLAHIHSNRLNPWQIMYLFAGGISFLWGIALLWVFPDTPQRAKGFTESERELIVERTRVNNAGTENKNIKFYQIREALFEFQFWGILILSLLSCTGSAVVTQFASIVFNGLGFDAYTSLLLNLPTGAMAFICVLGSGYLGRHWKDSRFFIISLSCLPVILGCSLLWKLDNSRGGKIFAFYLLNFFSSAWVQCIGLGTSNTGGYTKKAVYASGTFIGYSLGNITGSLLFDQKFAPKFGQSFTGVLICFVICFFLAQVVRFVLDRENEERTRIHGPPTFEKGLDDLSDRENISNEDELAYMRNAARPGAQALPLNQVIGDMAKIMSHRIAMDHPRFFGFIPSPVDENSFLGSMLTTMYNVGAGSWYQSSGASTVEDCLIKWFAEQAGLPPSSGGIFVSGGSVANLTAVVAARDAKLQFEQRPKAVIYMSEQTHSSMAKGIVVAGFHRNQIRRVQCDSSYRIKPSSLRQQIESDRKNGLIPFMIAATCGLTNTGGIDDLNALADIAESENLWLHVDGAYGASILLSKTHKHCADGIGRADSLTWDAHKWLFQVYDCGLILVRDKRNLIESFATGASYIRDADEASSEKVNFWNRGIEMSRPARGMKLWFTLQRLGLDKVSDMIDHGVDLAEFAELVFRGFENWEILSPAQLGILNFRYVSPISQPLGEGVDFDQFCDKVNAEISRLAVERNIAAPLTTRITKVLNLRMCTVSPHLSRDQLFEVIQSLDSIAKEISASFVMKRILKI